jgi:hypothetical protein
MYVTKYGTIWGLAPRFVGQVLFVAPADSYTIEGRTYSSSDNNDGLSPERAVRTINRGIALANASSGDSVILLPGSHSVSTTVTVNKAGVAILGMPGAYQMEDQRGPSGSKRLRTSVTSTETAGIIFTVSAADCEIAYINFAPPAAGGRGISLAPLSGAANRTYIHDCTFSLIATASTTTYGITSPAGVTADLLEDVLVSRCYFVSGGSASSGANGPAVNVLTTAHGFTVEQSTFQLKGTAAWATAILSSNPGTLGLMIRDCDFIAPTSATTVITNVIDCSSQTVDGSTTVLRCYFTTGPTKAVKASATPDIAIAESYTADATSGTLVAK